jgi:hypothetical protein
VASEEGDGLIEAAELLSRHPVLYWKVSVMHSQYRLKSWSQ